MIFLLSKHLDFVEKPWQNEKLLATVMSALKLSHSRREVGHLRQRQLALSEELDQPFKDFIGPCTAMQQVFGVISKVAATDARNCSRDTGSIQINI